MPATGRGVWKLPRARLIARLRRSTRPDGRLSAWRIFRAFSGAVPQAG